MAEQSSLHSYLNWTKQRLDEMDATLASLESKAGQVQASSKAKAEQMVADLKKQRDDFQALAQSQAQAAEGAMAANKAQLESHWRDFETELKTYFDTVGKQVEQQQTTFKNAVAAQAKAWQDAMTTFHNEASKFTAARRGDVDAAVKQMQTDAAEAEARFNKLKQAGSESWAAFGVALAESRKAFDRANQQVADALKNAGSDKSSTSG